MYSWGQIKVMGKISRRHAADPEHFNISELHDNAKAFRLLTFLILEFFSLLPFSSLKLAMLLKCMWLNNCMSTFHYNLHWVSIYEVGELFSIINMLKWWRSHHSYDQMVNTFHHWCDQMVNIIHRLWFTELLIHHELLNLPVMDFCFE